MTKKEDTKGTTVLVNEPNSVPSDDQYLQDFVTENSDGDDDKARLSQVVGEIGGTSDDAGATDDDKAVQQFLEDTDPTSKRVQALKKLQAQEDKLQIGTQRQLAIDEAKQLQERQALRDANRTATQVKLDTVNEKVATPIVEKAKSAVEKVSSLPTVGSIGLLVTLLLVLLFVVVNVDGKGTTRLKQFWYMLNGRASIRGRVKLVPGSQGSANGVSGGAVNGGNPSINNGIASLTGLPPIVKGTLNARTGNPINYNGDLTGASNQLNRDLLLGSGNIFGANPGDVKNTASALKDLASLNKDYAAHNDYNVRADTMNLQNDLNALNQVQLNGDFHTLSTDIGF
jgi:hypothetical protein